MSVNALILANIWSWINLVITAIRLEIPSNPKQKGFLKCFKEFLKNSNLDKIGHK